MKRFLLPLMALGILSVGLSCSTDEDPVAKEKTELDVLRDIDNGYLVPTIIKTVVRDSKEFTVAYFTKEFFEKDFKGNYIFIMTNMYINYFNSSNNIWDTHDLTELFSWFKISDKDSSVMDFAELNLHKGIMEIISIKFKHLESDRFNCFYSKQVTYEDSKYNYTFYIPCMIAEGKDNIQTFILQNPDLGSDFLVRSLPSSKYNNLFPYNYDFSK